MIFILKFYLVGCLISALIELVTMIRIRDFTRWDWIFLVMVSSASWVWVVFFLTWIYSMMGWDYTLGNGYIAWRLKRRRDQFEKLL